MSEARELRDLIDQELADVQRSIFLDNIVAQAKELWRHLPDGEVSDDEPLLFTMHRGRLIVRRGPDEYHLFEGHAVRLRRVSQDERQLCIWHHGVLMEMAALDLSSKGVRCETIN